ncbi:efflux RND transporter permease subunit [Clostridiaceae bacterium M8S5]|nr:efflux RND transporter permease subunit [Clostridiaceae bacterium M8S5]
MNIYKFAVKRPVTVVMIILIAVLLGVVSLTKLPIDLLPEIQVPVTVVVTNYTGVGPQEIEKLITKPIEESLMTMNNIKQVTSISNEGMSIVIAELDFGVDMDFLTLEMREKIDQIKSFLPEDSDEPMVMKIDPNAMAIMQVSLYGSKDLTYLQRFAHEVIKPRLERIEGVASVNITGGNTKQVEVVLDKSKIEGYGLSQDYIAGIISASNFNLPGGEVKKGSKKLIVRTIGEFTDINDIRDLPVPLKTGGVVNLKELADVDFANKHISTISRMNSTRSINLFLQKQSGTNTVSVANEINDELSNIKSEYKNIKLEAVIDQSKYIKKSINEVVKDAIFGALLAIIILYIFLKNLRTTFIIGTSIPISIIVTFVLLYASDITLNLMTLGGLALGVGMLVDNAIVVLENIYRFRQEGFSRVESAIKGAKEVGMAVTASTLTTIAVFLPIVYVEGITSTIFKELALTITLSLVASLGVSLTLIPMLSSKILKVSKKEDHDYSEYFKFNAMIYRGFDRIYEFVVVRYKRILKYCLDHRKASIALTLILFVVSMSSLLTVGREFFPKFDEGQFNIQVTMPTGSQLEETTEIVTKIEKILSNVEDLEVVYSTVGSNSNVGFRTQSENIATITVLAKDLDDRDRATSDIANEVRNRVKDIAGVDIEVKVSSMVMSGGASGPFSQTPISLSIKGDDIDTLKNIGDDIKDIINNIEGAVEVTSDMAEGVPEIQIVIDKLSASSYGLSSAQIANAIKSATNGKIATRYKHEGDEINVIVKGSDDYTRSTSQLKYLNIQTQVGMNIPLGLVAKIKEERGPVSIRREGQARVVKVTGSVVGRDVGSVGEDIRKKLQSYKMPDGYDYEIEGQNKELVEAFEDLGLALVMAVLLVYMILASQFESLLHPFVIMLSVPLAYAGGALGLFITRRSLSVPSIIGFIILTGIVVNDSIVLISYINTRRNDGENRRNAILNAGPIRLRPILMTTFTTVLGLVPIAIGIGEGSEALAPLGAVVIGGMLLSTFLILVFIPVVYTIFDDLSLYIKRKIKRV